MGSLAITPNENPVFYAVIGWALQRSLDRGVSWEPVTVPTKPNGRSVYTRAFAIDYRNPETQYLTTDKGHLPAGG